MYLEHFGLSVNPFSLSPKLDFLYQSETFEESMAHLVYGLDNQEAIVLVTGPIGTGKSMALQSFLSGLGPHYESALVTNTRVEAIELLKLMLEDLGVEFPPGCDKSDLLILFKKFLREAKRKGRTVLLIVDEAQNLAPEVLEELRLLTNLGQGDAQPVQIILVGQPELEDLVNRPDMAQIRQRIRVHYTLAPLNRGEIEEYLNHRMKVAGCPRAAFSKGAVDRIYQLSGGVPRVVNTHAGDALLSAFVAGHDVVRRDDVEEKKQSTRAAPAAPVDTPDIAPQRPHPPAARTVTAPEPRDSAPSVMATRVDRGRSRGRAILLTVVFMIVGAVGVFYYWDYISEMVASRRRATPASRVETAEVTGMAGDQVEPEPGLEKADLETRKLTPTAADTIPTMVVQDAVKGEAVLAKAVNSDRYYIHVSSFREHERALAFAEKWNYSPHHPLVMIEAVKGITWNRVYVGPFASHDDAVLEANRLEEDGAISYYAVKLLSSLDPVAVGS